MTIDSLTRSVFTRPAKRFSCREPRSSIECLEARIAPASVTTGGPSHDSKPEEGNFIGDDLVESLLEAILEINKKHGGEITFTVADVTADEDLPILGYKVTINGMAGADGPGTVIHGTGKEGFILAKGGHVSHLVINGFKEAGLTMDGPGTVEDCYIGTDKAGTVAVANGTGVKANSTGVIIKNNLISGNTRDGVEIGSGSGVKVLGNKIGVDVSGLKALANENGIFLHSGSLHDFIGGSKAGDRNIISGNTKDGIVIETNKHVIAGNYIGIGSDGMTKVANGENGVRIDGANSNIIGGTTEAARNIIAGNGRAGVKIAGSSIVFSTQKAMSNVVEGNFLGLVPSGDALRNALSNVDLEKGAEHNTIGGTKKGARNIISGSTNGVLIKDGVDNLVMGNYLGTGPNGDEDRGNVFGVALSGNAEGNRILKNLIAGGGSAGVDLSGNGVTKNEVAGNWIGLTAAGSLFSPYISQGVVLHLGAHENLIGGYSPKDRNVIAGGIRGVTIEGSNFNAVEGNYIGVGPLGNEPGFGNFGGIQIENAVDNTIGKGRGNVIADSGVAGLLISGNTHGTKVFHNLIGTDAKGKTALPNAIGIKVFDQGEADIHANLISGNTGDGIRLESDNSILLNNQIGTDLSGKHGLPNGGHGIAIAGSANTIGDPAEEANIIAFNLGDGVRIESGSRNLIEANSIFLNGGLGIKLLAGAQGGQVAPTIATAGKVKGKFTLTGNLAGASNASVLLELFTNKEADPSGLGEGQTFLSEVLATTDAAGNFTAVFKKAPPAHAILSLTASINNGTSAFSLAKTL